MLKEAHTRISDAVISNTDGEQRFVKGAVTVALGSSFSRKEISILRTFAQSSGVSKVITKGNRSRVILTFRR